MTNGIAPISKSEQSLLDEIERLRALNAKMLAALRHAENELVVDQRQHGALTMAVELLKVIRAAIAEAED